MKTITTTDIPAIVTARKGAQAITFTAKTDARLKKTGNPFAMPVKKISVVNGIIGFRYEDAVNRQRGRECENPADFELFEAQKRAWGEKETGNPIIVNGDKRFLEIKVERSLSHRYEDANGLPLTDAEVAPFLPKKSSADNQGVDKEIVVRSYSLENILELRCDGEVYNVAKPEITVPAEVMAGLVSAIVDKVEPGEQLPLFGIASGSALIGKSN